MSVQTTFAADPAIGMPGRIYDSGTFHDIVTLKAQEALPFGTVVRINGEYCELPDNSGEVTGNQLGVVVADASSAAADNGYPANHPCVAVLKTGRIWAASETALANDARPFVRFAVGTASQQGAIRNDADTASAVQVAQGIKVYCGNAAAGLVVRELGKTGE